MLAYTSNRHNRPGTWAIALTIMGLAWSANGASAQSRTNQNGKLSRNEIVLREELMEAAQENANRLMVESRRSFERGLITLADYSNQLDVALKLQLRAEQVQPNPEARLEALEQHAALLAQAAQRVENFRQPASRGWAADVFLSRGLAAKAALQVATAREDRAGIAEARAAMQTAAQNHMETRLEDFRVGLAELPEVAVGAELVQASYNGATANQSDAQESLAVYQKQIGEVARQTDILASRGAGLGRADRVEWAAFETERAAVLTTLSQEKPAGIDAVTEADTTARSLFETQMQFAQRGTANLADVSLTWIQRDGLFEKLESAKQEVPEEGLKALNTDFDRLMAFAENVKDLRGRNAADVTLVQCLSIVRSLNENFPEDTAQARTARRPVSRPYDEFDE